MANSPFHLDFGGQRAATPDQFFGVSSAASLMTELNAEPLDDIFKRHSPRPEKSIGNLTKDMAATFIPGLSTLNTALSIGEAMHKEIKAVEEGKNVEDVACKTAKIATELVTNTAGSTLITTGVPLLVTESIAFPPLAFAIPVVGQVLPQAYANMEEFSKLAGEQAEEKCHELFRNF
jgi:hypothetical protein